MMFQGAAGAAAVVAQVVESWTSPLVVVSSNPAVILFSSDN